MAPRARPGLRLAALVAGVAVLGSVPTRLRASPPEPVELDTAARDHPSQSDDGQALEVARAAFAVGLDAYRAGDFARAVESWDSAHRLLVVAVDDTQMQRVLGFDLAQALLRLHASDRETSHFGRVRVLLEDYILWIERPGHAISNFERSDLDHAKELLALVEIDAAAAIGDRRADPLPPTHHDGPYPHPRVDRGPAPPAPVPIRQLRREMHAFIAVGAVSCALAISFAAVAGVMGSDQREREHPTWRANRGIAATAALTTLFGLVGIGALSVGLVKRRAVLRASPTLSRTRLGVAAELAF